MVTREARCSRAGTRFHVLEVATVELDHARTTEVSALRDVYLRKQTRFHRRAKPVKHRRRLLLEMLEDRRLLVGDWRNAELPADVSNDGHESPRDALLIVNALNHAALGGVGRHRLPVRPVFPVSESRPHSFDVNGDGWVTASDALRVVNRLNQKALAL